MNLKPWRELITPHTNVLNGTFQESEFAADLNKVVNKTASKEYQNPGLFFERTYITEGMKLMLESVAKRITGNGGDPVVQLQTAFGGGKTHAMMAVYHMVKGEEPAEGLPGVYSILAGMGISDLPSANVAVLDGNNLSPSEPRQRGDVLINTLWGEMAWQLGGDEGYRMLEKADRDGTNPGKEIIANLFSKFSPAIILMDETVAYVRQFAEERSYAGGTFGSNLSFLQALTEAAGHVPTAMVIASLPESDLESGGERGRQALRQIEHLFHRLEAIWKPVSPREGFEIVRRRIFTDITDADSKETVCRAYAEMYAAANNYPSETKESEYLNRLIASYPVHPEVFDRLYEDWASMENFQRTRGVLRLMAMVVHRLWVDGNRDLMIMPGSLPLGDNQIKSELIRYLPSGWDPVMEKDVDGERAAAMTIDKEDTRFGAVEAARRVSRTIFLGSAPSAAGQRIRGLNAEHIRLGCTQPGQSSGVFDDALRRLNDKLHFLYSGQDRYWFDTQTNLRREVEDRMHRFKLDEHMLPEIASRLKNTLKGKPFTGIHVFTPHGDIPDDSQLRLVVLSPKTSHLWKKENTQAIQAARVILGSRGKQPRLNQNRLVFLCADEDAKATVYDQTRRYLAWKSIVDDKSALNLDQHRLQEATSNQRDFDARLNGTIYEAFKWLLTPFQEPDKQGGVSSLAWEEEKVLTAGGDIVQVIARVLIENEMLILEWSPFHLKSELIKWYFKGGRDDYGLLSLWQDFCRYPYLPRLVESSVLQHTIAAGIKNKDFFGYATGKEGGRYVGMAFGESAQVFLDMDSLITTTEAAQKQLDAELEASGRSGENGGYVPGEGEIPPSTGEDIPPGFGGDTPPQKPPINPPVSKAKRFHGSITLNPISASIDFSNIVQEVIQHFSSDRGTDVTISLEIEAVSSSGFKDTIRRTVQENCKTLSFDHAEFEEE